MRKRRAGRAGNLNNYESDEYSSGSYESDYEEDEYGKRIRVRRVKRKGKKSRSPSKERSLSIERAVKNDKMYDYYMDKSKGITKKAENDRGMLSKLLDLVKKIRLYDLKRIRNKELEELNLNLTGLKTDWSGVKSSL